MTAITATEETKVGIMLAQGYTKKEIANTLHKSINTVNQQTRVLHAKTGCRNLADITRYIIQRYSGIPVADILLNAMRDISLGVLAGLLTYILTRPGMIEKLAVEIHNYCK